MDKWIDLISGFRDSLRGKKSNMLGLLAVLGGVYTLIMGEPVPDGAYGNPNGTDMTPKDALLVIWAGLQALALRAGMKNR